MKTFKPNANYFGRKSGTLEDIVSKINESNPKPEVFDIRSESKEYKAVFAAAMKKFKISSPADLKSEEEKKKFFDYVDAQYKAPNEPKEQMDDKAQMANQSRKNKDGEKVKMSVKETVKDMLLKSWKQAAQVAEDAKQKQKEALDKEDEKTVKDVIKGLDKAVATHKSQAKQLEKDISDSYHDKDKKKDMKAGYMKSGYMKASYGKKK